MNYMYVCMYVFYLYIVDTFTYAWRIDVADISPRRHCIAVYHMHAWRPIRAYGMSMSQLFELLL